MTVPPDVSVVVVTYRCARFIRPCLDAVLASTGAVTVELIVVDNDSDDGSLEVVEIAYPSATTIQMGSNTGFARAVNAGVAASNGRLILLLNPDTEVDADAIATLAHALDDDPRIGVVAPLLRNSDGTDQATARSFPTPAASVFGRRSPLTRAFPENRWSRRYLRGLDHEGTESFPVDWVSGACLMVRRDDLDTLGGLDEGFFMHFEDADLCHRMKDRDATVVCVPSASVVHHEGGCRNGWPADQVRHFHYGAYRYWTKHHAPQPWNPLRALAAAAMATRATAVIAGNGLRHRIDSHRASDRSTPSTSDDLTAPAFSARSTDPSKTRVMQP